MAKKPAPKSKPAQKQPPHLAAANAKRSKDAVATRIGAHLMREMK